MQPCLSSASCSESSAQAAMADHLLSARLRVTVRPPKHQPPHHQTSDDYTRTSISVSPRHAISFSTATHLGGHPCRHAPLSAPPSITPLRHGRMWRCCSYYPPDPPYERWSLGRLCKISTCETTSPWRIVLLLLASRLLPIPSLIDACIHVPRCTSCFSLPASSLINLVADPPIFPALLVLHQVLDSSSYT